MENINITCEGCKSTHEVNRTQEIPNSVISMGCNWCPKCEDSAQDYYKEWYNDCDKEITVEYRSTKLTVYDFDKEGDVEFCIEDNEYHPMNTFLNVKDLILLKNHIEYLIDKTK